MSGIYLVQLKTIQTMIEDTYLDDWVEELVDKIAHSICEIISNERVSDPAVIVEREYNKLPAEKNFCWNIMPHQVGTKSGKRNVWHWQSRISWMSGKPCFLDRSRCHSSLESSGEGEHVRIGPGKPNEKQLIVQIPASTL